MNKKQLIPIFILTFSLLVSNAVAGEIIKPLRRTEVEVFLKRLNQQKILVSSSKDSSKDKIAYFSPTYSFFRLEDVLCTEFYINKADINNDGIDEYILYYEGGCGSGSFLDIGAIYKEKNGKLIDILDEIKKPMNKIVEISLKGNQDLGCGYAGFMYGSLTIEKEDSKTFFTLRRKFSDYKARDNKLRQEGFKMFWDKNGVKLLEHYIGDKTYKIEDN